MKRPPIIRRRMILRAAARSALHQAGKAQQELSETAKASAQGDGEERAEHSAEASLEDSARTAGAIPLDALRLPYAQYRAVQAKRAASVRSPPPGAASRPGSGPADTGQQARSAPTDTPLRMHSSAPAPPAPAGPRFSLPDSTALPHPSGPELPSPPGRTLPLDAATTPNLFTLEPPAPSGPGPLRAGQRRHIQMSFIQEAAARSQYTRTARKSSVLGPPHTVPTLHRAGAVRRKQPVLRAADGFSRFVKSTVEGFKRFLVQAVQTVGSALLLLLPAGAVAVLCILSIGIIAALLASPMGILFAGEIHDPNGMSIPAITAEANQAFGQAINDLVAAHPECSAVQIQYDYEDGHTWASYWPEVLAVFAVHANLNTDTDVLLIDDAKKQLLLDTFWLMHRISSDVTSEEIEVELPDDAESSPESSPDAESTPEDPPVPTETQTVYTLHITVSSRTVEALAAEFQFSDDQLGILQELLSPETRPFLAALAVNDLPLPGGALLWPLPGYSHISTHFGAPDAFGHSGHKGIDIPAPEGTPIYAAHSGTVLIAAWNNSYGNQVFVDSGDGTSTRYAHMTSFAVSAGEAVLPGQVIGYVGSTGDSTGDHLHFEVMINGALVDPLTIVSSE